MTRGAAAAPGAASEPASLSPADLPEAPTVATPSPVAAPSAPRPQRSVAAATGSLSEEIASFERARSSLESGDVEQAVALLDGYEKRYPTGAFWQEAEVLRVKALTAKGDVSGARRAGERFLAANPTSPHAPRIRAILESSDP